MIINITTPGSAKVVFDRVATAFIAMETLHGVNLNSLPNSPTISIQWDSSVIKIDEKPIFNGPSISYPKFTCRYEIQIENTKDFKVA